MWYESIICISDLQEPFSHEDTHEFLLHIKKKYYINSKKTKVMNLGDEADFHALGKFPKDPDGMSAGYEYNEMIRKIKMLWDIFPEQDICLSNHMVRPLKRAFEAGIPKAFLREIKDFMQAPNGVRWEQYFVVNGIRFEHGENVSGPGAARQAALQNRMSTIIGHQHSNGGVQWIGSPHPTKPIYGLNTGCLIDVDAYAFAYGKALRNKPTLGLGVVADQTPIFEPMLLDENERWIGRK